MEPAETQTSVWQGADGSRRRLQPSAARRPPPAHALPLLRRPTANLQGVPFYRIFAADSRCPRDGKHLEQLGHYDPVPGGCTGCTAPPLLLPGSGSTARRGRRKGKHAAVHARLPPNCLFYCLH